MWNTAPLIFEERRFSRLYRGRMELIHHHIFVSHAPPMGLMARHERLIVSFQGDTEALPPCARCGAEIGDDDDVLLVYSKTEAQVEAEGGPSVTDLGDLVKAHCERCTHEIEGAHAGHDQSVGKFKEELDRFGT